VIQEVVDNLMKNLSSDQLIRITIVNNTSYDINSVHYNISNYHGNLANVGDTAGGSNTTQQTGHRFSILGSGIGSTIAGSGGSGGGGGGSFDINNMIGRTAHICYLENPVIAFQLIQSLFPYFIYDHYPH
jgi:hypothetical protein